MIQSRDDGKGDGTFKKALRLLSCEGLDGAAMVVERELENDPESWEAWSAKALACNTKGNILYMLGRHKEAIECYNRAIELEPLFIRAWYNKRLASELQLNKSKLRVHCTVPRENIDRRR